MILLAFWDYEVRKAQWIRMYSHVLYDVIFLRIFPSYSLLGSNECIFINRRASIFMRLRLLLFTMILEQARKIMIYQIQNGTFVIHDGTVPPK